MKMSKLSKLAMLLLSLLMFLDTLTAQNAPMQLSIEQAKNIALQQNKSMQTASLDAIIAKRTRWETISNYLPKATGSVNWSDNLELATVLLPGIMIGRPGEYIPVQFGMEYQMSWAIQAQQVIFSAPLIVGIQLANLNKDMVEKNFQKTEQEVITSVNTIYASALILKENMDIIDSNINNLYKVKTQTKAMYEVGVAQSTDVDQIDLTILSLENAKRNLQRNLDLSYSMLRFQLGLDTNVVFQLTTHLSELINETEVQTLLNKSFDVYQNIDYQLMEKQKEMAYLNLKKERADALPTIAGVYTYSRVGQGNEMNNLQWFPTSVLGLSLSIPILAGGQNGAQISKAKLQYQKAQVSLDIVTEQLKMQENQQKYTLSNAYDNYIAQKRNIELAKRIYDNIEKRYLQGVSSSLDLTQANSNYLTAQNNYLSAILELLQAKYQLEKIYNN
jgi:outer membrane protein TolC